MSVYFDTSPFITTSSKPEDLTAKNVPKDPKVYVVGVEPFTATLNKEEYHSRKNNGSTVFLMIIIALIIVWIFLTFLVPTDFFAGSGFPKPPPATVLPTSASQASKMNALLNEGFGNRTLMLGYATISECNNSARSLYDSTLERCVCNQPWNGNFCSLLPKQFNTIGTILNSVDLSDVSSSSDIDMSTLTVDELSLIVAQNPGIILDPFTQTYRLLTTYQLPFFTTYPSGETLNRKVIINNLDDLLLSDGRAMIFNPLLTPDEWWNSSVKLSEGDEYTISESSRLHVLNPSLISITVGTQTYSPTFSSTFIPFNPQFATTIKMLVDERLDERL